MNDTVIVFDKKYTWGGNLGSWFKSSERGVSVGTVRLIRGRLFHVWLSYSIPFTRRRELCWVPVDEFRLGDERAAMAAFKGAL